MKIARAAVDFVVHIEVLCCPRGGQPWLCSAAFLVIPASLLTVCCAEPLRRHWYRGGFDTGSGEEKWQAGLGFVLRGIKNIYLTLTHFFFFDRRILMNWAQGGLVFGTVLTVLASLSQFNVES